MAGATFAGALGLLSVASLPALAHPHVWVSTREEIVLDDRSRLVAIRHAWTFDPEYSAFAVVNLDSRRDGVPDADKLAELARTNIESLADFGYFTQAKLNGTSVAFADPSEYRLEYRDKRLVLHFTMRPKAPSPSAKVLVLSVDDPTFFVSFGISPERDAVTLSGGSRCALDVKRPSKAAAEGQQLIPDDIATAPSTDIGGMTQDYASRVLVACP